MTGADKSELTLDGQEITVDDLKGVASGKLRLSLGPKLQQKLQASRHNLLKHLENGLSIYGCNTGVGALLNSEVPEAKCAELSLNLIRSHACGVGENLSKEVVRGIIFGAICHLSQAYSGVRPKLVQALVDLLNSDIIPHTPSAGSIGSLTHMAHISLCLIGEGRCNYLGRDMTSAEALELANLQPLTLAEGEGLSLISGTSSLLGIGGLAIRKAQILCNLADAAAALSFEALRANPDSLHPKVHQVRPHPGQNRVAERMRAYLNQSELVSRSSLQDCLSLRTTPQVHGSTFETIQRALRTLQIELNSATDNPLIFEEDVVSACNAHGEPMSQCLDAIATALSELGNISERRTDRLLNFRMNGLPAFLSENAGLHSGLMILQYVSAYLVSENKVLSHPVSVDSIPMSAFQEDHVNMGTLGALMAIRVASNVERILAAELIAARTALGFLKPKKEAPNLTQIVTAIDSIVEPFTQDRALGPDIENLAKAIAAEELVFELGDDEA